MKQIISTVMIYIGIAAGGWIFHEKVLSDIEKRGGFPIEAGQALRERVIEMDIRINKRLDTIDADIKKILSSQVAQEGKAYGSLRP